MIAARTGVSQVPPGLAEAGGLPEVVFDNFAFTQLGAGPNGERRVRVDFRINVPLTAGSESYIFTAPLGANFEAGGVAGFPGFSVQVIRVFGTGDEQPVESDALMYIRRPSGGLGAGAHAVSITVNFPACNSWLVNFAAELYQSGPGSTLIGMGSTAQFVPAACDECAGAVLSVAPLGADPPEVLVDQPSTLTWAVSLAGAPAEGTTFNLVLTTPPAEFSGGTVTASGFVDRDDGNPTNPRATAYVSVTWPTPGTKVVAVGVQAVFGTCTKFLLAEPTAVFVVDKPKVVLDVFDSDRKLVARPAAGNRHAWVVVNDDDDDYSGTPDKDNVKKPVAGEDDFIRMDLKKVVPPVAGAVYLLDYNLDKIKVYRAGQLEFINPNFDTFDANKDAELWVEGLALSGQLRDAPLRVLLAVPGQQPVATGEAVDFTVYQVEGAANVPGTCVYTYRGTKPMMLPGTPLPGIDIVGSWSVPTPEGRLWEVRSIYVGSPLSGLADEAEIEWGAGGFVGNATYTVVPGFYTVRKVNVVRVEFVPLVQQRPTVGSIVYDETGAVQGQARPEQHIISAAATSPHVSAAIGVKLTGAPVAGTFRGVKRIEVGFIYLVQYDAKHSDYRTGTASPAAGKRQQSNMVGKQHLVTEGELPWVSTDRKVANGKARFIGATTDPSAPLTQPLEFTTRHRVAAAVDPGPVRNGLIERFGVELEASLVVAVRTSEERLGSRNRFYALGTVDWRFSGSGAVDKKGTWTRDVLKPFAGLRIFTDFGGGLRIPDALLNTTERDLLNAETWVLVPRPP